MLLVNKLLCNRTLKFTTQNNDDIIVICMLHCKIRLDSIINTLFSAGGLYFPSFSSCSNFHPCGVRQIRDLYTGGSRVCKSRKPMDFALKLATRAKVAG